jgi:hypothetical protein
MKKIGSKTKAVVIINEFYGTTGINRPNYIEAMCRPDFRFLKEL